MDLSPLNVFITFSLALYMNGHLGIFLLRVEPLKEAVYTSNRGHKLALHKPHPAS